MKEKLKIFEIFSPKIKLPKHGYTKIELKDPYTGRKQVYEDENLITKALEYYLANAGFMNDVQVSSLFGNSTYSATEMLLGGVVLFDTAQVENVETIAPVSGSKMTANGVCGVTNNGDPLELGSYSTTESGWQQDGSYVQTYDFSTTQGNGDIACACLTSRNAGYLGFGNASGKKITNSSFKKQTYIGSVDNSIIYSSYFKDYIVYLDQTNSIMYAIPQYNIFYNSGHASEHWTATGKIVLNKYRAPFSKIDLRLRTSSAGASYKMPLIESVEVTVPSAFMANIGTMKYDGDLHPMIMGGFLHLAYMPNYSAAWAAANPLYVCSISFDGTTETFTIEPSESGKYLPHYSAGTDFKYYHYTDNNTPHMAVVIPYDDSVISYGVDWATVAVVDCAGNTATYLGDLEYTDDFPTNVESYSNTLGTYDWEPLGNGIYITNKAIVDIMAQTVRPINNYATDYQLNIQPVSGNPLLSASNYNYSGYFNPYGVIRQDHYIASVNNLSTPVTKTADKTMKVSYRITF